MLHTHVLQLSGHMLAKMCCTAGQHCMPHRCLCTTKLILIKLILTRCGHPADAMAGHGDAGECARGCCLSCCAQRGAPRVSPPGQHRTSLPPHQEGELVLASIWLWTHHRPRTHRSLLHSVPLLRSLARSLSRQAWRLYAFRWSGHRAAMQTAAQVLVAVHMQQGPSAGSDGSFNIQGPASCGRRYTCMPQQVWHSTILQHDRNKRACRKHDPSFIPKHCPQHLSGVCALCAGGQSRAPLLGAAA